MVRRDPETGKFVSSGSAIDWHRTTRLMGVLHSTIPAADLSGATNEHEVLGDGTEIVDFGTVLGHDEVFRIRSMRVNATLGLPTTSTAESSAELSYTIGADAGGGIVQLDSSFYAGKVHREEGLADIAQTDAEVPDIIAAGELHATADFGDSVNGLGAGADYDRDRYWVHFGDEGPVYDADDELYAEHEFGIDNVSDHAVNGSFMVLIHGVVEELD